MHSKTITAADVKLIHADICEEYPETSAQNPNANVDYVEQAVSPTVMSKERLLFERAASLLRFLVESHPFPDGNKRTAYNATAVFLGMHGFELKHDHSIRTLLKLLGTDSNLPDQVIIDYLTQSSHPQPPNSDLPRIHRDATFEQKHTYATTYRDSRRDIFDALATE